ncbi:YdcF family protein [Vibrio lentus]|nr:YdcF family protein [Vibrio lentus]
MMSRSAGSIGVTKPDIILLETKERYVEEARCRCVRENKRMVLVTSASHMTRALNEFNAAGMKPLPAPTNYLAQEGIVEPWNKYMPKSTYLEQTERCLHETMGLVWQSLT